MRLSRRRSLGAVAHRGPYAPPSSEIGPDPARGRLPARAYFEAASLGMIVIGPAAWMLIGIATWVLLSGPGADQSTLDRYCYACAASAAVGIALGVGAGRWSIRRARSSAERAALAPPPPP